jgi:hypothetical protein
MPAKKSRESRGFANRARADTPNFPGAAPKNTRRKKTRVESVNGWPQRGFTARPAFCSVGVTGLKSKRIRPRTQGGLNDVR